VARLAFKAVMKETLAASANTLASWAPAWFDLTSNASCDLAFLPFLSARLALT
jgi:hypothetical protein